MTEGKREFTCVVCPQGCLVTAQVADDGSWLVDGHTCERGKVYVHQELTAPERTIASSVLVSGGVLPLASVRTESFIPKEKIMDAMKEIKKVKIEAPVQIGDVIIEKVAGTGVNIIATKNVAKR